MTNCGVGGERAGDVDALQRAGAEVARPFVEDAGVEIDEGEQLADALALLLAGHRAVHVERLGEDLRHGPAQVDAVIGVLEHDLHLGAQLLQAGLVEGVDVVALEIDPAVVDAEEPHDRAADGGLARAALADEAERLAGAHRQVEVGDGLDLLGGVGDGEMLGQAGDGEQGRDAGVVLALVAGHHHGAARLLGALAGEVAAGVVAVDDAAAVEHHDAVAVIGDDAVFLGDQQHRGMRALHRLPELVEELRLDGDVEAAGRLVGDQQLRHRGERHRDQHALGHAAGELVRE